MHSSQEAYDIDLAKLPGITDVQLATVPTRTNRINARCAVTQSITFDKKTSFSIIGTGLEPSRHSRVLQSIHLQQSDATEYRPTRLYDEFVSLDQIPYKPRLIKLFKQKRSSDRLFGCYCMRAHHGGYSLPIFDSSRSFKHGKKNLVRTVTGIDARSTSLNNTKKPQ